MYSISAAIDRAMSCQVAVSPFEALLSSVDAPTDSFSDEGSTGIIFVASCHKKSGTGGRGVSRPADESLGGDER